MKRTEWSHKHHHILVITLQIVLDFATICVSFLMGYYVYHFMQQLGIAGKGPQPFLIYVNLTLLVGLLFIFIFERFGLYRLQSSILNMDEMKRMVKAVFTGAMILFTISFYIRPELQWSRLIVSYSLLITLVMMNLQRLVVYQVQQRFHLISPGHRRILIYGAGEVGQALLRKLFQSPKLGMKPVGFIDDDEAKQETVVEGITGLEGSSLRVYGSFEDLTHIIEELNVDEVLIAMPSASANTIYHIIKVCADLGVGFSYVPNLFDLRIQKVRFEDIDGIPLLRLKPEHRSFLYLAMKRIFDFSFSVVVLALFLPFFPVIAWLIKRDSRGPIFFIQERVGKDGVPFNIVKFRTMYCDTPPYCETPNTKDDPRITPFGHFLRRSSLDEIPQFLNVLKGDMSVVGPRPEMAFVVEMYNPTQRERLRVRPGITGLWQISQDRATAIHKNVDYDLYYTENQSLLLDILIILRTIYSAIRGIGAY